MRDEGLAALTPRELEALRVMAEGRTNAGIARVLGITEGAAEKHTSSICGKLTLPDSADGQRRMLAELACLGAEG